MSDAPTAPAVPTAATLAPRFRLDGRVAIVTGASRGIGAAIARGLAEAGARVVVSSRRQDAVDVVAQEIGVAGGEALALAATVGRPGEAESLVARTIAHYGGVDILVNNAATNPVFGPVLDADAAAFERILAVNVQGPLAAARAAYASMQARGHGVVLNVASVGGLSPEPGLGLYSVSKAALVSLTQVLAREWGPAGVRANVICPGLIRTRFSEALWGNDRILQHTLAQQALPRIGEPIDVAGLAVFLASDAAAYCTGGVYVVDGGYLI